MRGWDIDSLLGSSQLGARDLDVLLKLANLAHPLPIRQYAIPALQGICLKRTCWRPATAIVHLRGLCQRH